MVGDPAHSRTLQLASLQLLLTNFEMEKYMDETYGTDNRILKESDVACTILHSYGNAFRDCPCGYRALRFSERSLQLKGLRGFFVHPPDTSIQKKQVCF